MKYKALAIEKVTHLFLSLEHSKVEELKHDHPSILWDHDGSNEAYRASQALHKFAATNFGDGELGTINWEGDEAIEAISEVIHKAYGLYTIIAMPRIKHIQS